MELQLEKDLLDQSQNLQAHPLKHRLAQCRRNLYVWSLGRIMLFRSHSINIIVLLLARMLLRSYIKLYRRAALLLLFRPSINSRRCSLKLQVPLLQCHQSIRIFYATPVIFCPAYLLLFLQASHRKYCNITQPCMASICARSSLSAVILTCNHH